MIRVTRHNSGSARIIIRFDGRLTAEQVPEARRIVHESGGSALVTLDLSGLAFVDGAGRELLLALRSTGCALTGGSLYVRKLLEEEKP